RHGCLTTAGPRRDDPPCHSFPPRTDCGGGKVRNSLPGEATLVTALALFAACNTNPVPAGPDAGPGEAAASPGLVLVAYRATDEAQDGIALVDADPASPRFGEVVQRHPLGQDVLPHHLYWDPAGENLWATALGGPFLYRLAVGEGQDGSPEIIGSQPIPVGDNVMAEDMWFTDNGDRYYVTFLGGHGGKRDGSVGVFSAANDTFVKDIRTSADGAEVLWPHGISGDPDAGLLLVTSSDAPPPDVGIGSTVTAIDLATNEAVETFPIEEGSGPVEVLVLRGDALPRYAIVSTMYGGDLWVAPFKEDTWGAFTKAVEGDDLGHGTALELYVRKDLEGVPELYVTNADPGVVNVYGLDALPELPLKRTIETGAGAHHLTFFESEGRLLLVSQNNLLDIEGLNEGTLSVTDAITGEALGDIDLTGEGILPESVESAWGRGYDQH
ncbi:MAG: YncE family protein, partial [Myxococcota bacterium]